MKIFEKNVRITNVFKIMRTQSGKRYTGMQKKSSVPVSTELFSKDFGFSKRVEG